jgi:hypothetical protein
MKAKLRFHLAKGINFMKWQYTDTKGVKHYQEPETFQCFQKGKLRNQVATATKINKGANKTVCAWIDYSGEALSFNTATSDKAVAQFTKVFYNPRKLPYWHDAEGNNLDNATGVVAVIGRQIYLLPN